MHSAIALLALPLVLAQSSTTSSSAAGATHEVSVGQNGLTFTPDTLDAAVGDVVKFNFYPQRHSVAQSTFDAPCQPRDGGIFSGYVSEDDGPSDDSFTVPINNTDAIWLYCSAGQHCQAGMVMVINPAGGNSATNLENFKTAAGKATENRGPEGDVVAGGLWVDNDDDSSSSSGSATSTGASSSATSGSGSGSTTRSGSGTSASATGSSTATSSSSSSSSNAASGLKVENGMGRAVAAVAAGLALGAWAMI